MAAALQVEGIDYLDPIQLGELDDNGDWQVVDPSQPITLQPWEVVQLSSITVVPGPPLPPGQPVPAPPPPSALLPIPVPKDQC
jgi:hypothetical protein